ncbi:MAG: S9 family peptidase [Deltaproteobacteria bacterium]|nr:S9 family peptidase [Deltaproteobacteria bacterium]
MRTIPTLALGAILFLGTAAGAQPRRAITFDDFIRLKRVSDPRLSPDGRRVAFVVATFDKAKNTKNDDIWVVDVAGGAPRALTTHEKSDKHPSWSPDGRRLAFVSSRGGTPQVWVLPLEGGEPHQVTNLKTGVAGRPVWSRDGKWLLFPSPAFPECKTEACNKAKEEAQEESKVKARLYDDIPVRRWDEWRDRKRSHLFVVDAEGRKAPRDLTPGPHDVPPIDLTGPADYDFSPDGREVAFTRVDGPAAWSTNAEVYVVPFPGGAPRKVTRNPANDSYPRYSPDGRFLAWRAMQHAGYEADRRRLVIQDRASGALHDLTAALDRSVEDFSWSPDSRALYFSAEDEGYVSIYAVDAAPGAKVRRLVERRFTHGFGVAPNGTVVYAAERAHQPPELFRFAAGRETPLTTLNAAALRALDLKPAEPFSVRGARGDTVHGFIVKPPGFAPGRRYPAVMIFHGGPQGNMGDDWHWRWNYQMFARAGYVIVAPNFHGSSSYGSAFQDAIRGDWGGAPYEDVMKALDHAVKLPHVDGKRVCAAGASYGGYLVNWTATRTDRFRCFISHDGLFNLSSLNAATEELWFPEWEFRGTPWENREIHDRLSPSRFAERIKTPMLVIHGEQDMRVPVEEALQLFGTLRRRGVPARLLVFPDEGHFVQKAQNAEVWWKTMHEWLARWLSK